MGEKNGTRPPHGTERKGRRERELRERVKRELREREREMKLLKNATSGKKVVRTKALLSRGVVASRSSSSSSSSPSSSRTRREERRRDLKDTLLCFAEEERGGKQLGAS